MLTFFLVNFPHLLLDFLLEDKEKLLYSIYPLEGEETRSAAICSAAHVQGSECVGIYSLGRPIVTCGRKVDGFTSGGNY